VTTLYSNGNLRSPSGFKVSAHSYASLEQVAEELRVMLPLVPGEKYKLDCRKILEQTLPKAGYQYKVEEVGTLDECAAFTIPTMGLVVFREDIYDLLQADNVFGRSTVVHELAHIVLEHEVTLHRGAVLGQHKFCQDSEWQAKALTAAVMMPIEACKQASSPEHLARMCGTSVQSARYRLERLLKDKLISPQRGLWGDE
jgi:hypothetical protein